MTFRILLLAILTIVRQTGFAQSIQAPRLHVLDNGMRIITVEDHSSELIMTTWRKLVIQLVRTSTSQCTKSRN